MATRVLLQRRSLAAVALGAMALAPATVFAEAPSDFKRKPIYDDFELPATVPSPLSPPTTIAADPIPQPEENKAKGPTPTDRLAVQVGSARMQLYKFAVYAESKVNQTMDSAFNLEKSFTNTVASLAPSRETGEKLMPGTIYVLVAAMAGSIITRNRNIILRASVPLALGIGAGWTVLPHTMRNVSDLAWTYEKRFPVVADSHIRLRESLKQGVSFAKVHKDVSARFVEDKVTDARETVEGWVRQGK